MTIKEKAWNLIKEALLKEVDEANKDCELLKGYNLKYIDCEQNVIRVRKEELKMISNLLFQLQEMR